MHLLEQPNVFFRRGTGVKQKVFRRTGEKLRYNEVRQKTTKVTLLFILLNSVDATRNTVRRSMFQIQKGIITLADKKIIFNSY